MVAALAYGNGARTLPRLDQPLSSFTDSEHPCRTDWANALSRRTAILHDNGLGVTHLLLGPALDTIGFQDTPPDS